MEVSRYPSNNIEKGTEYIHSYKNKFKNDLNCNSHTQNVYLRIDEV